MFKSYKLVVAFSYYFLMCVDYEYFHIRFSWSQYLLKNTLLKITRKLSLSSFRSKDKRVTTKGCKSSKARYGSDNFIIKPHNSQNCNSQDE